MLFFMWKLVILYLGSVVFIVTYFLNFSCLKSLKCPLLTAQFLEQSEEAGDDPLKCFASEIIVSTANLICYKICNLKYYLLYSYLRHMDM